MVGSINSIFHSGSYIRAGRAFLVMFIIALAISGYINLVIYGYTIGPRTWGRTLGETTGGALGLIVLPAIVVVPWRLIQRRRGTLNNAPIVVGGILFAFVSLYSLVGATTG